MFTGKNDKLHDCLFDSYEQLIKNIWSILELFHLRKHDTKHYQTVLAARMKASKHILGFVYQAIYIWLSRHTSLKKRREREEKHVYDIV